EGDECRPAAGKLAADLLERQPCWPNDQPRDREVWHPATEAEAHLLLRKWQKAARTYRAIPAEPWERDAMLKQVHRILGAWRTLGETKVGPFHNPAAVFGERSKNDRGKKS